MTAMGNLLGLAMSAVIGLTLAYFTGDWFLLVGMVIGSCVEIVFRPLGRLEAWWRNRDDD